ncbi:MAG TPA: hypothetical protein VK395_21875 [Gemmataceae bacterium]|nr:hypothetical protein [Gemmataceae bacterium]
MIMLSLQEIMLLNLEGQLQEDDNRRVPKDQALQTLKKYTGQDFGYDAAQWRTWLLEKERIPHRDEFGFPVPPASKPEQTPLELCRNLAVLLRLDGISFDDYARVATPTMVSTSDEDMQACVDLIPATFVSKYFDYLRALLEPVDFIPDTKLFLFHDVPADQIEARKQELRPKYQRLYQLVRERLCATS